MVWLNTLRIKTLTASFVPVVVAHFIYDGKLWITLFALLSACFIQIGTDLFNDAYDSVTGIDTDKRKGPLRAVHLSIITPGKLRLLSHLSFLLAVIFGIPLVIKGGVPIVVIGLISVAFGYLYSVNLSRSGLADLAVIIFFGIIPLTTLSYLHTDLIFDSAWIAGLAFGLYANVLLSINNIRDLETDKVAGRKTIPVRVGSRKAKALAAGQVILGMTLFGLVSSATLLVSPLGIMVILKIFRGDDLNKTLTLAGLLHLLTGIVLSAIYMD